MKTDQGVSANERARARAIGRRKTSVYQTGYGGARRPRPSFAFNYGDRPVFAALILRPGPGLGPPAMRVARGRVAQIENEVKTGVSP